MVMVVVVGVAANAGDGAIVRTEADRTKASRSAKDLETALEMPPPQLVFEGKDTCCYKRYQTSDTRYNKGAIACGG